MKAARSMNHTSPKVYLSLTWRVSLNFMTLYNLNVYVNANVGHSNLKDLIRSIDADGLGGIDRQVTEKMSARAKRFNLETSGPRFEYEDFVRLYDAFGVPEGEREEEKAAEDDDGDKAVAASGDLEKKFRLQASVMGNPDLRRNLDHIHCQNWDL